MQSLRPPGKELIPSLGGGKPQEAVPTRETPGVGPGLLEVRIETTAGTGALTVKVPHLSSGCGEGRTC